MKPKLIKDEPKILENVRENVNKVFKMLINGATKEEMQEELKIDNRTVRDCVSHIKKKFPVIAHSGKAGYRLAITKDDLEEAYRTRAENKSRAKHILEANKALDKFIAQHEVLTF